MSKYLSQKLIYRRIFENFNPFQTFRIEDTLKTRILFLLLDVGVNLIKGFFLTPLCRKFEFPPVNGVGFNDEKIISHREIKVHDEQGIAEEGQLVNVVS